MSPRNSDLSYPTFLLFTYTIWTVPKVLPTSRCIAPAAFPSPTKLAPLLKKEIALFWQDLFLTNPCWLLEAAPYFCRGLSINCFIIYSRNFLGIDVGLRYL